MPRKKETLTLSIPTGTREQLNKLADRLGYYWGKSPSPSALVTAIAQGKLEVGTAFHLTEAQVSALQRAVKDMVDAGHIEEAKNVITLLLGYGNLHSPLRQALIQQIDQPMENLRTRLDQLIAQNQPFHLVYRRPSGTQLEFTVRYAKLIPYEKRLYLQIWCEETEDSQDVAEIQHNRSLRLERIQGLATMNAEWRGEFDSILVEMQLLHGLAYAYEPRIDDVEDEQKGDYRRVVRRIYNTFWFEREILRYGADCIVVSPDVVRDRIAQTVQSIAQHYETSQT